MLKERFSKNQASSKSNKSEEDMDDKNRVDPIDETNDVNRGDDQVSENPSSAGAKDPEQAEGIEEVEIIDVHETQALREELQQARLKAEEYLDGWQRSRAEFANYKKRIERDQAQVYQLAAGNIIKRYLEIVDDLERALNNKPQEGEGAVWAQGIELIYRKFISMLESEGVKPMLAEGEMFDPNLHEAISQEDSREHESGQVIGVIQQGYTIGDRVLRPALVRVAR
jgi:molecular chaperone GrpE